MPRARSPFVAALADLKEAFAELGVDWYVFGAQAALLYGGARVTADVDVTVRLGNATSTRLANVLTRHGFSLRIARPSFVRTTRVLPVLHVRTAVPADIVLAGPGLEDAFLERAVIHDLGGVRLPVARAEDLIVMKIIAGRDKDLEDVAAMVAALGKKLDSDEILTLLAMVEEALGQSDLVPEWKRLAGGRSGRGRKKSLSRKPAVPKRVEATAASTRRRKKERR